MKPDKATRDAWYRQGLCCDCGQRRYSAGRPRCDDCHKAQYVNLEPGLKRVDRPRRTVRIRRR